jgi:DHA2 family multidrug resistance protein-like MFS transporter
MLAAFGRSTSFVSYAVATSLFSLGVAPVFTLTTDLIIGTAPPERAGAASALSETSAELGGALGIALFGSIGVAIYRHGIADGIPSTLSRADAAAALSTLGGALASAERLSPQEGAVLIEAGRSAFLSALQLCAGISAAGLLALAVFVLATMRHVKRPG